MLHRMPTDWRAHLASQRYLSWTKQDQMYSKTIAAKARRPSHAAINPTLHHLYPIPHTCWHANRLPFRNSYRPRSSIQVDVGHWSSGSTSSSTKSRATSPLPRAPSLPFGSPLRRDARLAEEEEDAAVYGLQRADGDEDIGVERASSREKKKLTLGQAQAEEAQQKLVEREKRRICEDFEVTA